MMLRSGKSSISKDHIRMRRREADLESPVSRREGRCPARGPLFSPRYSPHLREQVSPARSRSPATRGRSR